MPICADQPKMRQASVHQGGDTSPGGTSGSPLDWRKTSFYSQLERLCRMPQNPATVKQGGREVSATAMASHAIKAHVHPPVPASPFPFLGRKAE